MSEIVLPELVNIASPLHGRTRQYDPVSYHSAINKSHRERKNVTFANALQNIATVELPTSSNNAAIIDPKPSSTSSQRPARALGYDGTTVASTSKSHLPNHQLAEPRSAVKRGGTVNASARRPSSVGIRVKQSPLEARRDFNLRQGLASGSSSRKAGLPWLDGSRSRQSSLPPVPGAFVEDDSTSKLVQQPAKAKQTVLNPLRLDIPVVEGPYIASSSRHRRKSWSESSRSSVLSQQSFIPNSSSQRGANRTSLLDPPLHLPHRTPTPVDYSVSQPAIPLIELARQFHFRDSGLAPDAGTRNVGRPRRSFSDSSVPTDTQSNTDVVDLKDENNPTQPGRSSTPLEIPRRKPSALKRPLDVLSFSPQDNSTPSPAMRRSSMAVQPIRSDKVRVLQEDQRTDEYPSRKVSLSVQPIKARTWKTISSDEEVSTKPPGPLVSSPETHSGAETLRSAVAGLENLLYEALRLAKEAAEHAGIEGIPALLEEAKIALRQSAQIQTKQDETMRTAIASRNSSSSSSTPEDALVLTPQTSGGARSNVTVDEHGRIVNHTARVTKMRHDVPVIAAQTQPGVRTVWDEEWPNHRLPPEQHDAQSQPADPSAFDWAYSSGGPGARNLNQTAQAADKRKAKEVTGNMISPSGTGIEQIPVRRKTTIVTPPHPSPPVLLDESDQYHGQEPQGPFIPARISSIKQPKSPWHDQDSPTDIAPEDTDNSTRGTYGNSVGQRRQSSHIPNWGRDKFDEKDFTSDDDESLTGKNHITLKEGQFFSFHMGHRHQPIARNWDVLRKRFTASVACINTALVGILIGIYAGEVPAIQYALADQNHHVILGNVVLYISMAISVFLFWPLPLLHGRKPYTIVALAFALPLQIPQAVVVSQQRGTQYSSYMFGLLFSRALSGLALGFAHINFKSTLLDLYGASLQSDHPHGELVIVDDIRRHGGGMGLWLGIWSWCFIGSLAIGFLIGADIISGINVSWGFYISVIMIAATMLLNVLTPETRRAPHRRTLQEVELPNDTISRRVARGEIKMHVYGEGPKWWWEEVWAGIYLSFRMLAQTGFLVMAVYLAWIYAQIVLIIVLLGNLLSAGYHWRPEYVGLGVFSIAVGALLAIPVSQANIFSRARVKGPRTDSMTLQPNFTWTSHLVRRLLFMIALPIAGLAYTLASVGDSVQFMLPIIFAGLIGYISNLAIAECNGLIMETFDTSDLQPGANSRHRLQSLPPADKQKRTTYSSYPRVSAGFFVSQSLGFLLAAAATGIGGAVTRKVGAQRATAITAGILFGLTLLLTAALLRYKDIQVIPNELFGHYFGSSNANQDLTRRQSIASMQSDRSWRAVIIGNPSGKVRRMSWLELGSLSRWTEVRRLNRLLNRSTTQSLNPGWR